MRTLHTMAIGDRLKWGIHDCEVKRILIDEQGFVSYELEHGCTMAETGVKAVKRTWVKESECQQPQSG
jgi:hypothetical protein